LENNQLSLLNISQLEELEILSIKNNKPSGILHATNDQQQNHPE
jgi:hypothetical protein